MWLNIPQLQMGNMRLKFLDFQNRVCCEKYLKDNKHNSLHLARKYWYMYSRLYDFVLAHDLFLRAYSLHRAMFSESVCLFLETYNLNVCWDNSYFSIDIPCQMEAIIYMMYYSFDQAYLKFRIKGVKSMRLSKKFNKYCIKYQIFISLYSL